MLNVYSDVCKQFQHVECTLVHTCTESSESLTAGGSAFLTALVLILSTAPTYLWYYCASMLPEWVKHLF